MLHSRDEVNDAVLAFVNAQTWDESKRIVEEQREALLTDTADEILADLLTKYRGDEDATRTLEEHRALLARCRQQGIDAGFANRLQPPESELESLLQELSSLRGPGEMPQRVAVCREALTLVDRNDQPELWAVWEVELGDSLRQNPQGDREQNIEEAISHCELALEIFTREDYPEYWALTQSKLALSYSDRIRGNRGNNIEEAISRYEKALEVHNREDSPLEWAATQNKLAIAYWDRIRGEREQNTEEVISRHELALEVYTREDFPEEWALTQDLLAGVYSERIRAMREQNREEVTDALFAFVDAQTWDECKRIVEEGRDALLTDAADQIVATLLTRYRDDEDTTRILKHRRELLTRCRQQGIDAAFASYSQPPEETTPESELESLLQELSSLTAPVEMTRRIAVCREALALIDRDDQPELWAGLEAELGDSLRQNPQGDRAQNIEDAISCYEQALEVRTREDFPAEWAATQCILAIAYRERVLGDRTENMELTVSRYEQALEVFTREDFPADWAQTQNNLGNAYQERICGVRAENLETAISHCEQALEVHTREDLPVEWARIQNGLARAYLERVRGDKVENIEEAISRYKLGLEVFTREDFPVEWALTQYSLANAYEERGRGDRDENLEDAVRHHRSALDVLNPDMFPQNCQEIARSLGYLLYGEHCFSEARAAFATAHEAVVALRDETRRGGVERDLAEENADMYGPAGSLLPYGGRRGGGLRLRHGRQERGHRGLARRRAPRALNRQGRRPRAG